MSKRCNECKRLLPLEDFIKDKNTKDGTRGRCKICVREYCRKNSKRIKECHTKYRMNNKKRTSERSKEYRQNNKEKINQYLAEYYLNNKEKILNSHAIYRKTNKDKIQKSNTMYRENNREKFCIYEAERRAKKINHTLLPVDSKMIWLYYAVCNETNNILGDTFFHVDHIQPLNKGGLHHEDNLQILEVHLNLQKHNKWPLTKEEQIKYEGYRI